jgi:hypothetical protein
MRMLAKKTAKNRITLPESVVLLFPGVNYFEVVAEEERIVLVPLRPSRAEEVRAKLAQMNISEGDVEDAVLWARGR